MRALIRFVEWMSTYEFVDRKGLLPPGLRLQYHSRSDMCERLRQQAAAGHVAYGINYRFRWPNGKDKTLDLVIGTPAEPLPAPPDGRIHRLTNQRSSPKFSRLLVACEEKSVMTEHGKSQPRIYSELNDAHTIVHQGSRHTIATCITMVNIARTFIAPLRQRPDLPLVVSEHRQPYVTSRMVEHLRKLPMRDDVDAVGLEAMCTFVVDVNNQGVVALHADPPAPQPGDPDHYETFLNRICRFYTERFSDVSQLPPEEGLTVEEALRRVAAANPGLLSRVADLVGQAHLDGASDLEAILRSLDLPDVGAG